MAEPDNNEYVGNSLSTLQSVGGAAQKAGSAAKSMGTDALTKATETLHDAQSRASDLGADVVERAESIADVQKDSIAERLYGVAKALHQSSEALHDKEEWLSRLIERGADEMTGFAKALRSNDMKTLFGDLQSLARRQPALFMGTSVAAGFALARIGRVAVTGAASQPTSNPVEAPK